MATNGMTMTMKGTKLVIEVDCSDKAIAAAPQSSSGKNKLIASTGGYAPVGTVRVSLNVIPSAK